MWLRWYQHSDFLELPVLAMIIFMIVFVVLVIRTFKGDWSRQHHLAELPLRDGHFKVSSGEMTDER